jgi:hypothetical protein
MGGELELMIVYGFVEPTKWIRPPDSVPVFMYAMDNCGSSVVYVTHALRIPPDRCVGVQYLQACAQEAEKDATFLAREKPVMDALAKARHATAAWCVVLAGEIEFRVPCEEGDGYDSDLSNSCEGLSARELTVLKQRRERGELMRTLERLACASIPSSPELSPTH